MAGGQQQPLAKKIPRSIVSAPEGFFDSASFLSQVESARLSLDTVNLETVNENETSTQLRQLSLDTSGKYQTKNSNTATAAPSCHNCETEFDSFHEQRMHFKSDWHRYNVKRRLIKKLSVTEEVFEATINQKRSSQLQKVDGAESDLSSISGSEDESESESVNTVRKQAVRSPKLSFELKNRGLRVVIFRALVTGGTKASDESIEEILPRVQALTRGTVGKDWIVILCAGGHFAAIVVNSRSGDIIAHQTFHRYVVRARAGGRQSTQDATGRAPKSAGSSLRRYNEAALQKDVNELLISWEPHLKKAALIFIHAPSTNQKTIFSSESNSISRGDPRVRTIPMSVRRPTLKEAKRVFEALVRIDYVEEKEEEPPMNHDLQKQKSNQSSPVPANNSSEEAVQGVEQRVEESGATEPLESENVSSELHEAAKAGDVQRLKYMLDCGADPTVRDKRGYTPYMCAKDKETRNVFRRFMAASEEQWDWHAAGVPSILTEEMEAIQAAKKAEKDARKKVRDKERRAAKRAQEREQKEKAQQESSEAEAKAMADAKLKALNEVRHGVGVKGRGKEHGELEAKLLEEAKAHERDLRLAAVEKRVRSSVGAHVSCDNCQTSLNGKIPFSRLEYKYCSMVCVKSHREKLKE